MRLRLVKLTLICIVLGGALPCLGAPKRAATSVTTHKVYAGQTLGAIARRYNVTIASLCHVNGISRRSPIKPGQRLLVPPRSDNGGEATRSKRRRGLYQKLGFPPIGQRAVYKSASGRPAAKAKHKPTVAGKHWKRYRKPARRAGYVKLKATGRGWKGYAIVKGNRLSPLAKRGFRRTLYSWRTGKEREIDPRLIRVLVKASDTFGGKTLHIASGYRERSHTSTSKHKLGRACDFSIPGVPNAALRDYLMTLPNVGVGYYPNSSFVHVDIRAVGTHWVDLSRPGERPRYAHRQRRRAKPARKAKPAGAAPVAATQGDSATKAALADANASEASPLKVQAAQNPTSAGGGALGTTESTP